MCVYIYIYIYQNAQIYIYTTIDNYTMIRYTFSSNPEDIFTATISTKETNPVRVLQKIIVTIRLECQKAFDDNHESEFEKWLSASGTDAITHIFNKYMHSNPQSSTPLNPLPAGGYSVCTVGGTFTITMRKQAVCACVSICVIMREEILPRLTNMLLENQTL